MAIIKNHKTTQINIVAIPNNPVDINSISIDKIKTLFSSIYEDSKPVLTQFPEIIIIFDPNNQVSINIIREQNRIIIADQNITAYSNRNEDNFLKLSRKLVDIINSNDIKNFGFNINSTFDLDNGVEDSGKFIKDNFIRVEKFESEGRVLNSAGFNVAYMENDIKFNLKLEPRMSPNASPTKAINVSQNVHYTKSLPELTQLKSDYEAIYSNLLSALSNII
jgi:hypothetical protein